MRSATGSTRELGRRGRRPARRDTDADGLEVHRELTFTSCLSIPAPGAVAIPKATTQSSSQDPPEHSPNDPPSDSSSSQKQKARKSKTDALAAITKNSTPPPSTFSSSTPSSSKNATSILRSIPESPELDLNSIPRAPSTSQLPRNSPRLFGLTDCPTYFPTAEEFSDPMAYITSISEEAEKFGICKIVPPSGWNMPFVTNTKTFRFKTRVQQLNSIEASSRAKLNFLEQLYRFHDQGLNPPTVPTIAHRAVDLWILRKEVHKRGGFENVTRNRLWGDIGRVMGYDGLVGVSTQLKTAYSKIIYPFDTFVAQVRGTTLDSPATQKYATRSNTTPLRTAKSSSSHPPPSSTPTSATKTANGHPNGHLASNGNGKKRSLSPGGSSISSLSSPDDMDIDGTADVKAASASANPTSAAAGQTPPRVKPEYAVPQLDDSLKGENCEICRKGDDDLHMLLCDGCDRGYHTYCLNPPIPSIPKGQWFCHACLFDTDYGFDEGEDHSLSSFQKRANEFKRMWFASHPPSRSSNGTPKKGSAAPVTEDDVEQEFWRLVESPYDSVEVEYGADIHSTTHGSAMPTLERHPLNEGSHDPWNLNNLPILPNSMLRYIKSDISGMTVPWTYVGMVFSTFCWHNEDHYTYSINYMHWGETKTWYGIPASEADKFEAAIKSEAPDLFETQPDLLFQLVTLMNPGRLREAGVNVYAADQRAGEFVITFPQAYHSGFNHGFNFNEAVNFALPAWLSYGRACAKKYQEHQKPPVFSHDELLLTITQFSSDVPTSQWLLDHLAEMKDRELSARVQFRDAAIDYEEYNDPQDRPEEQYQCSICKAFCYLSQVHCVCTESVACLEHHDSLCSCEDPPTQQQLTLRTRYTDDDLGTIYQKVADLQARPADWQRRLREAIEGDPRPSLKKLRALVDEVEEYGAPKEESEDLTDFVARAEAWNNIASGYLTRKAPVRKRGRKSRTAPEPAELTEHSLDDARALLAEGQSLGFDSSELHSLTTTCEETSTLQEKVIAFIAQPDDERDLDTGEVLHSDCRTSPLGFPEITALESSVEFLRLLQELDQVDDGTLTLDYVEELLERARASRMDESHDYFVELVRKHELGLDWKRKAEEALGTKGYTMDDIALIINPVAGTPTIESVRNALQAHWSKAKDMEKTAKAILATHRDKRSTPEEAISLVNRAADFNLPIMDELKVLAERGMEFSELYKSIITGKYLGSEAHPVERLFESLVIWRKEIKQDLWMLNIHAFNEVEDQLAVHERWIQSLPWFRVQQLSSTEAVKEAFAVLQDVLYETEKLEGDLPSSDCTCICSEPVIIAIDGPSAVQCDSCGAKFHENCISESCPFCDHHHWDGKVTKPRNYSLGDLQAALHSAPKIAKSYSAYAKLLETIVARCRMFTKKLDGLHKSVKNTTALSAPPRTVETIRHTMRKLYVIQFRWPMTSQGVATFYGSELAIIHRNLTNKTPTSLPESKYNNANNSVIWDKPHFVFSCENSPPGPDGCQCLCERLFRVSTMNPPVVCIVCEKKYHHNCIANPNRLIDAKRWRCPLCCAQNGWPYHDRLLRVRYPQEPGKYVDYLSWVVRRMGRMPFIHLPDPRSGEAVITLTLSSYEQKPVGSQGAAKAPAKKVGRPPGRRSNNGTPSSAAGKSRGSGTPDGSSTPAGRGSPASTTGPGASSLGDSKAPLDSQSAVSGSARKSSPYSMWSGAPYSGPSIYTNVSIPRTSAASSTNGRASLPSPLAIKGSPALKGGSLASPAGASAPALSLKRRASEDESTAPAAKVAKHEPSSSSSFVGVDHNTAQAQSTPSGS
ncbi:hypothetical protein DL93DRAFT_1185349 [Clavulina sp. PMI_390]|nr:hypothetical protein DL93DRAFT_1185349 [Clavulina sp. PMI_390]